MTQTRPRLLTDQTSAPEPEPPSAGEDMSPHDQTLRDIMQLKSKAGDADTQAMEVQDADDLLSNTADVDTSGSANTADGDGSTKDDLTTYWYLGPH